MVPFQLANISVITEITVLGWSGMSSDKPGLAGEQFGG
jgi:hypothetical protein